MKQLLMAFITAGAIALCNAGVNAADDQAPPTTKSERKGPTHIPFHGKLDALDKTTKTLKVGERTFQVTSETKITKAAKPALLEDAVVGEPVGGSYHEDDSGHLQVMSLRLGPKPTKAEKKEASK